jgi:hypothetical protein
MMMLFPSKHKARRSNSSIIKKRWTFLVPWLYQQMTNFLLLEHINCFHTSWLLWIMLQ